MGTKIATAIFWGCIFASVFSLAEDANQQCQAASYTELVRCADRSSFEIKISEQQLKSASALEGASRQWINPELDAESVNKGSEKSETTATLFFTIRLGGKRDALVSEAKGLFEKSKATRDLSVSNARLELILGLYRLSHLKGEIGVEEESVETFSKIVTQFQKRPALSPEQDVSLSVFKMASADHQLRLTQLKANQNKMLQSIVAATGISEEVIIKNLPARKLNWPALDNLEASEQSPQVRAAAAELLVAKSQSRTAEADAWPDLKIGPSVKAIKDASGSDTLLGFGLSMPIPLLSLNGPKKVYSAHKALEAELELAQTKRRAASLRNQLVSRYNDTVSVLKASLSSKSVSEKHEKIERQFFKGVVPSSLVIEAHRQLFELEQRRNESEFDAIESFGRVSILDNKFSEVIL